MPGIRVVHEGARRCIQVNSLLCYVRSSGHFLDAITHPDGCLFVPPPVFADDVFLVAIVLNSTLTIERGIHEIHARVIRLILIVAPGVKNQSTKRMHIEDAANIAVTIDEMAYGSHFPFGVRTRSAIDVIIARTATRAEAARVQEVVVAIYIEA